MKPRVYFVNFFALYLMDSNLNVIIITVRSRRRRGGVRGGGGGGRGRGRGCGGRDNQLLGKTIRIIRGPYKGTIIPCTACVLLCITMYVCVVKPC